MSSSSRLCVWSIEYILCKWTKQSQKSTHLKQHSDMLPFLLIKLSKGVLYWQMFHFGQLNAGFSTFFGT